MPLPNDAMGAVADLGLGDMLGQQVADETEEQRKKRMQQMELNRLVGPAGSMAATSLGLGGMNARY